METNWEPIGVHTQYTYQQMKAYQNFHMRKARNVSFVILVLWIIANIYFYVKQSVWVAGSFFSFFLFTLLLGVGIVIFTGSLYTKKRHAEATHMLQKGFFFEFHPDGFYARNNLPDFEKQRKIRYDSLYRIYDRGDMLYLYTTKKNALLVDLDRSGGRRDELVRLLKDNVKPSVYKG